MAVSEAVAFLNVVPSSTTPVTHLAIVLAPSMNGAISNGSLSFASLSSSEIGGFVAVAINAATDMGNHVSSSKMVRAVVHSEAFSLK